MRWYVEFDEADHYWYVMGPHPDAYYGGPNELSVRRLCRHLNRTHFSVGAVDLATSLEFVAREVWMKAKRLLATPTRVRPHCIEDLDRLRDHNDRSTMYGRTL